MPVLRREFSRTNGICHTWENLNLGNLSLLGKLSRVGIIIAPASKPETDVLLSTSARRSSGISFILTLLDPCERVFLNWVILLKCHFCVYMCDF